MNWKLDVEKLLTIRFESKVEIINHSYVGGGSINETFRIQTNIGDFFVKKNSSALYPLMFDNEALGINILGETDEILVPEVITHGKGTSDAYLILNFIESGNMSNEFWEKFAKQIANLHRHTSNIFGLDHNNYIGSLNQSNNNDNNWIDFFREERLIFQIKMARDNGKIGNDIINMFDGFFLKLDEIFPVEPPALIHGDLWSGNYMVNKNGEPVIIDPAVYYGNREMDLGMTQLFGGFSAEFYKFYNDFFPLENGWKDRLDYCNLYPLMVHVNLFGGGYIQSVKSILKRF